MRFLLTTILIFSVNLKAQEATQFYILKEKEINLLNQISSIFLESSYNNQKLIQTILKMNKVKTFAQLNKKIKIWIPSPTKQKQCNYVRTQLGLVNFKKLVTSENIRKKIIADGKNQCNAYDFHKNYIRRTGDATISSMAYSLFLKDIWKPNGIMSQIKYINGVTSDEDFKVRSVFIIPPIVYSNGCNYMEYSSGKIEPLVLINRTLEREELEIAFKCVGPKAAHGIESTIETPPEVEKDLPPPPKKHHLSILAATTYHYDQSNVSDVEVDIISGYAIVTKYRYDLAQDKKINFYGIFENYLEVKNRDLGNHNLWRKTLNYEKVFSKKFGYTLGLYEDWYFDNIEVDKFFFTSSLMPYVGLTYHDTFKSKYKMSAEIGYVPAADILAKERFDYGAFFHGYLSFPFRSWNIILGSTIDYTGYVNHQSQNISFQGGLSFSF